MTSQPDFLVHLLWTMLFGIPMVIAALVALTLMLKLKPRPGRRIAIAAAALMLTAAVFNPLSRATLEALWSLTITSATLTPANLLAFLSQCLLMISSASKLIFSAAVALLAWGIHRMLATRV